MTDGYGGRWNVGVSEVSETEAVVQAAQERLEKLQDAWKY